MKTLTERMDDLLEQISYCDFRTEIGIDKAKTLIRRALKTEQKLTRHACAENINDIDMFEGYKISGYKAYNAVMNTNLK